MRPWQTATGRTPWRYRQRPEYQVPFLSRLRPVSAFKRPTAYEATSINESTPHYDATGSHECAATHERPTPHERAATYERPTTYEIGKYKVAQLRLPSGSLSKGIAVVDSDAILSDCPISSSAGGGVHPASISRPTVHNRLVTP
jgi:hypothetical protein